MCPTEIIGQPKYLNIGARAKTLDLQETLAEIAKITDKPCSLEHLVEIYQRAEQYKTGICVFS